MKKINLKCLSIIFVFLLSSPSIAVFSTTQINKDMSYSLVNIKFKNGMCSGAILSSNVIVTAAHCMDRFGAPEIVVSYANESGVEKCDIANVIDHSYAPNAQPILPMKVHAPDILLLKTSSELCSGQPVVLNKEPLSVGDELMHSGYGSAAGSYYDAYQLALKIVDSENVKELTTNTDPRFQPLFDVGAEYYLYATPVIENTTACHGDSGGPLYLNKDNKMHLYALNGAVFAHDNLGAEKCGKGYLHLVTPIAPYYDWIQSQIQNWESH